MTEKIVDIRLYFWYLLIMQMQKESCLDKLTVFLPLSTVSILWDFFVLIYIIVSFVITIITLCYESYYNVHEILYYYFDRFMIVVMLLDILITLNTYQIDKGEIISNRKEIFWLYFKSIFFWVDISCFIISIVQVGFNTSQHYSTGFNLFIFIKVVKVYEFDKNIKRYALKSFDTLLIYEIIKNIVFLSLICFTLGAFIYLIDYNLYMADYYPTTGEDNKNPNPYWIIGSSSLPNIINRDLWVKITYSYYFIIVLLSGVAYGDLVPQNPLETLYVTMLMLFPLVIYSYVFNAVYTVISKKRERTKLIRKYQLVTKRYLQNLRVKKTLQTKLITYLTYIFKKTANDYKFMNSLAPSIKKQYLTHNIRAKFDFLVFEQLLMKAPLTNRSKFEDCLIDIIKEETFPERYKLILPPSKFKLYYINQGICRRIAFLFPDKFSDKFQRSQYICYYPFLTGTCTPKLSYQSASFVVAQSVDRTAFLELLNKNGFQQLKEAFFLMKDEKVLYHNDTIEGGSCFFCNSSAHLFENCTYLRPEISISSSRFKKRTRYLNEDVSKSRVYFRKKFRQRRIVLDNSPLYEPQQEHIEKFRETEVQCYEDHIQTQPIKRVIQLDKAYAFSVYYRSHNIMF